MSGLQFSLLKSNFTLGEDAYYIKRTQHVHYLGMPLHVSYKWLDVKNWTIYSSLGGSLQIPVYGKQTKSMLSDLSRPVQITGISYLRCNGV